MPCAIVLSSAYLVFLLRTMNLWKTKLWACIPLVGCFFAMIGLCVALPQNMSVERLPGDPFCNYQLGGWLSYAVLAACALFDLLNFALLGAKLSKSGIKGILRCLLPQTEANYDHEDVTQMLLQKTGIFTAAQFLLLISIAVVYGTLPELNYQLMQVACFHSISASMAGRIFRRAWRLSREHAPQNIDLPPGYQTSWAERAGLGGNGTQGMGGVDGIPVSKKKEQDLLRDDDSYVEGEFKLTTKEKEKVSSILPRSRPGTTSSAVSAIPHTGTSVMSSDRRPSPRVDVTVDTIPLQHRVINVEAPSAAVLPPATIAPTATVGTDGADNDAITFAEPKASRSVSPSRVTSPHRTTGGGGLGLRMAGRGRRASTSAGPSRSHRTEHSRRPQTMGSTSSSSSSAIHVISPSGDDTTEAYGPLRYSPTRPTVGLETSADSAHSRNLGVEDRLSRHRAFADRPRSSGGGSASKPTTPKDSRPAFVASPAMTAGPSSLTDSSTYGVIDFNAAKAAATNLPLKSPSTAPPEAGHLPAPRNQPRGRSPGRSMPRSHEFSAQSSLAGPSSPRTMGDDPLKSFWSTVQADEERHGLEHDGGHTGAIANAGADDDRPRTSRGGPLAPFGQREPRRGSFARRSSVTRTDGGGASTASSLPRPGTSHGPGGEGPGSFGRLRSRTASGTEEHVRSITMGADDNRRPGTSNGSMTSDLQHNQSPVGSFNSRRAAQEGSAIDETYRELERMANSPSVSSLRHDADRADRESIASSTG